MNMKSILFISMCAISFSLNSMEKEKEPDYTNNQLSAINVDYNPAITVIPHGKRTSNYNKC